MEGGYGALSPAVYALFFVFTGGGWTGIRGCPALVTWLRRQSFSRALFRTGYTLVGLISAYLVLIEVVPLLMSGVSTLSVMIGKLAVFTVVYELVSGSGTLWNGRGIPGTAGGGTGEVWSLLDDRDFSVQRRHHPDGGPGARHGSSVHCLLLFPLGRLLRFVQRNRPPGPTKRKMELLFSITTGINRSLDLREVMNKTLLLLSDVVHYFMASSICSGITN